MRTVFINCGPSSSKAAWSRPRAGVTGGVELATAAGFDRARPRLPGDNLPTILIPQTTAVGMDFAPSSLLFPFGSRA